MYTMPRCRDSIVNGRHLANEKQTKRGAREFALNDPWQKDGEPENRTVESTESIESQVTFESEINEKLTRDCGTQVS